LLEHAKGHATALQDLLTNGFRTAAGMFEVVGSMRRGECDYAWDTHIMIAKEPRGVS
jgi:hypothetical protein